MLADNDMEYLEDFEKYLIVRYPQRFELISFSSYDMLSDFLCQKDQIDILIINSRMFKKELQTKKAAILLILAGDGSGSIPEGVGTVKKYQHMDSLIEEILSLYAARNLQERNIAGKSNTRIASVFSPSGGSGKSSVAAGCSILCSRRGLQSFYLNLEDIPSTDLFFHGGTGQSFSNVIYHLKGGSNNLHLKLEGAKCVDTKTGVHFFKPPENIQEISELTDRDIVRLINEFKKSAFYSTVFVDMSSGFDNCNTAIMRYSDVILTVLSPDPCSALKLKEFKTGLDLLERKWGIELAGRIVYILNRADGKHADIYNTICDGCEPVVEIGDCFARNPDKSPSGVVDNAAFLSSLNEIQKYFLPSPAKAQITMGGGESIA